jgi:hypothetical protein
MGIFSKKEKKVRTLEDIIEKREEAEMSANEEETEETAESEQDEELKEESAQEEFEEEESMEQSALKCFGWKDVHTEKWLIKCVKVWYCVISFLWFVFGALTFAPIIFISRKLKPVLKDDLKALIASAVIYIGIITLISILLFTGNTDKVQEVTESV